MLTKELHLASSSGSKIPFTSQLFEEKVSRLAAASVAKFKSIVRLYTLLNIGFFALGLAEFFSLTLFLPFLAKTLLIAFIIAASFLTIFSYLVVRFYLQAKKPEELQLIVSQFIKGLSQSLPFEKSSLDYTRYATAGIGSLLRSLEGLDGALYKTPAGLSSLGPLFEKFSLWSHFHDLQEIKEMLHRQTISHCVEYVKVAPLDPAAHTALADAFIELYKIYLHPQKLGRKEPYSFIIDYYVEESVVQKFTAAASRALEELKIVAVLKPIDPWVHVKLATIYHHLGQAQSEIQEYEKLVQLTDNNFDFLLRLGVLYFQQNKQAEGLKVYQHLKKSNASQAEELILYYGQL